MNSFELSQLKPGDWIIANTQVGGVIQGFSFSFKVGASYFI